MEGLEMENVGIFYGHLECNSAIWYMLWPFGKLVIIWYISPRFGILYQEKSGNPGDTTKHWINPIYVVDATRHENHCSCKHPFMRRT
jgi:hypothetical protein